MSDELIRKSDVIEIMENLIYDMSEVSTIPQLAKQSIENLPPVNAVELPCKVGDKVYIIERDENGRAFEVTAYMFLAKASEAVICTIFVNNSEDVNDILQYHIKRTAENWDTYLSVFPVGDCFRNREEAEKALEDLKNDK